MTKPGSSHPPSYPRSLPLKDGAVRIATRATTKERARPCRSASAAKCATPSSIPTSRRTAAATSAVAYALVTVRTLVTCASLPPLSHPPGAMGRPRSPIPCGTLPVAGHVIQVRVRRAQPRVLSSIAGAGTRSIALVAVRPTQVEAAARCVTGHSHAITTDVRMPAILAHAKSAPNFSR